MNMTSPTFVINEVTTIAGIQEQLNGFYQRKGYWNISKHDRIGLFQELCKKVESSSGTCFWVYPEIVPSPTQNQTPWMGSRPVIFAVTLGALVENDLNDGTRKVWLFELPDSHISALALRVATQAHQAYTSENLPSEEAWLKAGSLYQKEIVKMFSEDQGTEDERGSLSGGDPTFQPIRRGKLVTFNDNSQSIVRAAFQVEIPKKVWTRLSVLIKGSIQQSVIFNLSNQEVVTDEWPIYKQSWTQWS